METQKPAKSTHHRTRMIRSMLGARVVAAIGGGGGSIVASGSRLASRSRMPGRNEQRGHEDEEGQRRARPPR